MQQAQGWMGPLAPWARRPNFDQSRCKQNLTRAFRGCRTRGLGGRSEIAAQRGRFNFPNALIWPVGSSAAWSFFVALQGEAVGGFRADSDTVASAGGVIPPRG